MLALFSSVCVGQAFAFALTENSVERSGRIVLKHGIVRARNTAGRIGISRCRNKLVVRSVRGDSESPNRRAMCGTVSHTDDEQVSRRDMRAYLVHDIHARVVQIEEIHASPYRVARTASTPLTHKVEKSADRKGVNWFRWTEEPSSNWQHLPKEKP
jgi:hypothetical protein